MKFAVQILPEQRGVPLLPAYISAAAKITGESRFLLAAYVADVLQDAPTAEGPCLVNTRIVNVDSKEDEDRWLV